MYIVHFDVVATILMGISLYLFYSQKNLRDQGSKNFQLLLWATFCSSFFDLQSALGINHFERYGLAFAYTTNTLYYLAHSTIALAVAAYAMSITGKRIATLWGKFLFFLPYSLVIVLTLSNYWNGFFFYFDDQLGYQYGPGRLVPYMMAFSYMIYSLYLLWTRKNITSRLTRFALPGLFVLPFLAILIQNFYTGMLLECFAISISLLLILFTIQNSNQLIDRECGVFNREAFTRFAGLYLENKVDFSLFLLCLQSEKLLRHIHSIQHMNSLHRAVSDYLVALWGKVGRVFYLEDGCFAVLSYGLLPEAEAAMYTARMRKRFDSPWKALDSDTELLAGICLIHCPDEASKILDIFDSAKQIKAQRINFGNSAFWKAGDLNLIGHKRHSEVESLVLSALSTDYLKLLYQPIFSVQEQRFVSADALMVLANGGREFVQQRELLRVAEHNGIMQRIGLAALNKLCSFFSRHSLHERGMEHIQLRLSGAQCIQSDLPQQVLAAAEFNQLDPRHICFEITETSASSSPEIMNINMKILSGQNASFALDDYGSGYTDLTYIMKLPFNLIKLDKNIVLAGFKTDKGRIVLESTIALIKRLDYRVVAEGVETREQASELSSLGCDYLQGFYYAQPLEEQAFLRLLAT